MDRSERDALDRHITGNYGEDQVRDAAWPDDDGPEEDLGGNRDGEGLGSWVRLEDADSMVADYRPWTALDGNHDPAPRTYHSDLLGAVAIPEDEA